MLKKSNIVLAKTKSEKLLSNLQEPYAKRLSVSWSRVRVDSVSKNQIPPNDQEAILTQGQIRITFIDYGLKDTLEFSSDADMTSMSFTDYEFVEMPLDFKMCPAFSYMIRLNRVITARILKKN